MLKRNLIVLEPLRAKGSLILCMYVGKVDTCTLACAAIKYVHLVCTEVV